MICRKNIGNKKNFTDFSLCIPSDVSQRVIQEFRITNSKGLSTDRLSQWLQQRTGIPNIRIVYE